MFTVLLKLQLLFKENKFSPMWGPMCQQGNEESTSINCYSNPFN